MADWLAAADVPAVGSAAEEEMDRPGKSGGRYVCELSPILPDSSAL